MVCVTCRKAGVYDHFKLEHLAKKLHSVCRGGTHCDCQHRTGGTRIRGELPEMDVPSLSEQRLLAAAFTTNDIKGAVHAEDKDGDREEGL